MSADLTARQILLVDDDAGIIAGISLRLHAEGFTNVLVAGSGNEAIGLLRKHTPDLIITDLRMKNGNGLQFIDAVNATHWTSPSPPMILCISAFVPGDLTREEAFRRNIVSIFRKPFQMEELLTAIRLFLTWKARADFCEAPPVLDNLVLQHQDTLQRLRRSIGTLAERRADVRSLLRDLSEIGSTLAAMRTRHT